MELRRTEVAVSGPDGSPLGTVVLSGTRITVGRLPQANDIALQPDPELLVTRSAHFTLEREGARWVGVDGGSVTGTFLRRAGEIQRVAAPVVLRDGDVVCVLAAVPDAGDRRFFELAFQEARDSQATRAVALDESPACLSYDTSVAR